MLQIAVVALNDNFRLVADHCLVHFRDTRILLFFKYLLTVLANFLVNLVGHCRGDCSLFLGICETAHSLELHILGKFAQTVELLLGFSRETRDKRCA